MISSLKEEAEDRFPIRSSEPPSEAKEDSKLVCGGLIPMHWRRQVSGKCSPSGSPWSSPTGRRRLGVTALFLGLTPVSRRSFCHSVP